MNVETLSRIIHTYTVGIMHQRKKMKVNILLLVLYLENIYAFSVGIIGSHFHYLNTVTFPKSRLHSSNSPITQEKLIGSESSINDMIFVPTSVSRMIKDVADAMSMASEQGIKRQIVRILLPRDSKSGNLGSFFEDNVEMSDQSLLLAPPDETWQGGILQLYRSAEPTAREILKRVCGDVGGVPPKIIEDRSIDESGVDGVGLLMTQCRDPSDDISCFVQPLQETVGYIESIAKQAGDRLVVILNPQWRNVDDALDAASRKEGFLGSFASFLGGKGGSLKRLDEAGFQNVFTIEGYVCKGGNVRLVKRFDSDWVVFAENDSETDYIRLGYMKNRPSYQDVDKMLDDKGISLKYARDIGLAPKLE